MDELLKYLAGGGSLALIGLVIRLTWMVSRIEAKVRSDMSDKLAKELTEMEAYTENRRRDVDTALQNIRQSVVEVEREGAGRSDGLRREFGETASALRVKIHECETWNRDTFVRKDSFEMVIGRIEKSIDKLGDKIEERIDRLVERIQPSPPK